MNLSSAYNIIGSSFSANAAQTALVSQNISNANTTGYTVKTANLSTTAFGSVDVTSVQRAANEALLSQLNSSTSQAAAEQALSQGLTTLAATVSDSASATSTSGATQNGASPSAMISNLQAALEAYDASPSDSSTGQAVVTAAQGLASSLNSASKTVQLVRSQADSQMSASVATINSLLAQFGQANSSVVASLRSGTDPTNAEDARDNILTQLSKQIGISSVTDSNGSMAVYTDSGATLFENTARAVTMASTQTLSPGVTGAAVMVDGVPITGPSAPMAIQSGALAGLANLRDNVAPQYQAQLDQMANGLIGAFAESDQSATPTLPTLPGLFTYQGATAMPGATNVPGLASLITVNASVDPSQGGNVNLLRDGGIASPGNAAYTYNVSSAASFTGRIEQLLENLSASQNFDPSAGIGASGSLTTYANASVSWIQAQNQQASNQADYQNSLATQAASALSNATGVNLDSQMNEMLNLENTYTTSAKLLTTLNNMFSSLLTAVVPLAA